MLYFGAILAIQVMTIVHIVRTGRTMPWLYVVIFLPLVGSIAYLVAEVLPEFMASREAQGAAAALRDRADPERYLRELRAQAAEIDTPQARVKLAEELARLNRLGEAAMTYRTAMTGLFADDMELQSALTKIVFEAAEQGQTPWTDARREWDRLAQLAGNAANKDRTLLLARLLHAEGDVDAARAAYHELTQGYSSIETRVRYAHFLYTQGDREGARQLLDAILVEAQRASPHVRTMNAKWFDQARHAMDVVNRG